jgi:hypothetical protein
MDFLHIKRCVHFSIDKNALGYILGAFLTNSSGADFLYIFFCGISWKNDFSKLFPRKIQFFPNIFGGKFSAEFSAEKMYEKSAPGHPAHGVEK